MMELEASQNEMRNYNSETFRLKACHDDTTEQLDIVKRENKNLAEEIKDLLEQVIQFKQKLLGIFYLNVFSFGCNIIHLFFNALNFFSFYIHQLGEGGRSIHELDNHRRRLQVDKDELQGALEEAEVALEQEENRVLRIQLELGQVRQEIDRKIQEKEEEFENTR